MRALSSGLEERWLNPNAVGVARAIDEFKFGLTKAVTGELHRPPDDRSNRSLIIVRQSLNQVSRQFGQYNHMASLKIRHH